MADTINRSELNGEQEKVLAYLLDEKIRSDDYEVKELSISRGYKDAAYVYLVTGLVGDEGTMAAILGRTRYHWRIGKRGGLQSNNGKSWVSGRKAYFTHRS